MGCVSEVLYHSHHFIFPKYIQKKIAMSVPFFIYLTKYTMCIVRPNIYTSCVLNPLTDALMICLKKIYILTKLDEKQIFFCG